MATIANTGKTATIQSLNTAKYGRNIHACLKFTTEALQKRNFSQQFAVNGHLRTSALTFV